MRLSVEFSKNILNLPKDFKMSKIVLNEDSYTIDVYGFSESFNDLSEGEYTQKKTLQWV